MRTEAMDTAVLSLITALDSTGTEIIDSKEILIPEMCWKGALLDFALKTWKMATIEKMEFFLNEHDALTLGMQDEKGEVIGYVMIHESEI